MTPKPIKYQSERGMGSGLLAICYGCRAQWNTIFNNIKQISTRTVMGNDWVAISGWRTRWTPMITKPIKYSRERPQWIDSIAIWYVWYTDLRAICYVWQTKMGTIVHRTKQNRSELAMGNGLHSICNGWHTQWTPMMTKPTKYWPERAMGNDLPANCFCCHTQWTLMSTRRSKYHR